MPHDKPAQVRKEWAFTAALFAAKVEGVLVDDVKVCALYLSYRQPNPNYPNYNPDADPYFDYDYD